MTEKVRIRVTEDDKGVFESVLTSLESRRPSKAETDILDDISSHFDLPDDPRDWPEILVRKSISIAEFVAFTLDRLEPFVEMVLDLYQFLSKYVSTTGGRTTHFEIQRGLDQVLRFPNANFPRRIEWIQTWSEIRIEKVSINWEVIHKALILDNGIFYGRVGDARLLQSLIIARREGTLSTGLRSTADRIHGVLLRAVRAWYQQAVSDAEDAGGSAPRQWVCSAFVPQLHALMHDRGMVPPATDYRYEVGAILEVILSVGDSPYRWDKVFRDLEQANLLPADDEEAGRLHRYAVEAAVFFCALWGLDEESFRTIAGLLTAHENRDELLRDAGLERKGPSLAEQLIDHLEAAMTPTGEAEISVEFAQKKLELLLLPYWRDRWFLYEVWTLRLVLAEALSMGRPVKLLGVSKVTNEGVEGTTWNLPTQKARDPVARVCGSTSDRDLLVWFQRETRSYSANRNIEPDVRITLAWPPHVDILILECKDRVKFSGKSAKKVARRYLEGTAARAVWIVNYEEPPKRLASETVVEEHDSRHLGLTYAFKPGSIDKTLRSELLDLLRWDSGFVEAPSAIREWHLVIDSSGTMRGNIVPDLALSRQLLESSPACIYRWRETVRRMIPEEAMAILVNRCPIDGDGTENATALVEFASSLPERSCLILVTDMSGHETIRSSLVQRDAVLDDPHYNREIAGRPIEVIII